MVGAIGQSGLPPPNFGLVNPDGTNFRTSHRILPTRSMTNSRARRLRNLLCAGHLQRLRQHRSAWLQPGAVNINDGLNAGITLDNYPSVPGANPNDQVVGQLDRTDLDFFDKDFKTGRTVQYSVDINANYPGTLRFKSATSGTRNALAFELRSDQQDTAQCAQARR